MAGDNNFEFEHLELAEKMLFDITEILEKASIPYILDYGTLLGIVRENRLLPWDSDIDLSVDCKYLFKLLKVRWKIWLKGYRTRIRYYKKDIFGFKKGNVRVIKIQTRKFLFFRGYRLMDIFIKTRRDNQHYYTVSKYPYVLKAVPSEYLDNIIAIKFKQKKYSVPKKYIDYLSYVYGDWKVPVKEWDPATSDNCVKDFSD